MRFKNRNQTSQNLEVNLVPMMDVIMTILTFFIIVSMTLTEGSGKMDISLPSAKVSNTPNEEKLPDPLIIGLNKEGQLLIGEQQQTPEQMSAQIKSYLQKNPQGAVILKADKKISYEDVIKVLVTMRDVGGEQVSLAIDSE